MRVFALYEAKARFSELIRRVREGQTIIVSYRGHPVAEIRPVERQQSGFANRFQRLTDRGAIQPAGEATRIPLNPVADREGALRRFLDERDA